MVGEGGGGLVPEIYTTLDVTGNQELAEIKEGINYGNLLQSNRMFF